jgi:hypothetical protein
MIMNEITQSDLQLIVSALDMQTQRLLLGAKSRAVLGEGSQIIGSNCGSVLVGRLSRRRCSGGRLRPATWLPGP